jgi:hypothetical protein
MPLQTKHESHKHLSWMRRTTINFSPRKRWALGRSPCTPPCSGSNTIVSFSPSFPGSAISLTTHPTSAYKPSPYPRRHDYLPDKRKEQRSGSAIKGATASWQILFASQNAAQNLQHLLVHCPASFLRSGTKKTPASLTHRGLWGYESTA